MDSSYIDIETIATTNQYSVYKTARIKDQHTFAKKQLKPEYEASGAERFRNEVRLLARLDHPNIIRVIDQQLSEFPLYVVTPLYELNLREWLGSKYKNGCNTNAEVQDIFERLLDAVAYAHTQGVIHRDLKPENVLLNSSRDVVLIDFNISVSPDEETVRLTMPGQMLGTPHYLAPEQLRDAMSTDQRADIYSLGIILYEMYGGKVGSSTLALDTLPVAMRGIVTRCTQADRGRRYSTVSELKRAWHLALDFNTKQSEVNEIEGFMLDGNKYGLTAAERVLDLLEAYSDDLDRIDRFFMEADIQAVGDLASKNIGRLEPLLFSWVEFLSEKRWPFSYTDDIARRIEALWPLIESSFVRAKFVSALIAIGNNHNRFYVWRVTATLIEHVVNQADVDTLIQELTVMDRGELVNVSEYLVRPRLNTMLVQIFPKNTIESSLPALSG